VILSGLFNPRGPGESEGICALLFIGQLVATCYSLVAKGLANWSGVDDCRPVTNIVIRFLYDDTGPLSMEISISFGVGASAGKLTRETEANGVH
jgi:hypothetical protein